jgi:hypothetical protein
VSRPCRSTAEREFRLNKTVRAAAHRNPRVIFISFSPPLSPPKPNERELSAGEAAPPVGPLTGVRRSAEGERAAVEPARGSALRWRREPTRRRPDKWRRTRGGPGPFSERIVFDDVRSGHGGEVGPSYR